MTIAQEHLQTLSREENAEEYRMTQVLDDKIHEVALLDLTRPDIPSLGRIGRLELTTDIMRQFPLSDLEQHAPDINFKDDPIHGVVELVEKEIREALPIAAKRALNNNIDVRTQNDTGEIEVVPLRTYITEHQIPVELPPIDSEKPKDSESREQALLPRILGALSLLASFRKSMAKAPKES